MSDTAGDSGGGSPDATISVKFTSSDKPAGQLTIGLQKSVGDLKELIKSQFSATPKRLIFQGRILNKDDQTLEECKLKDGLTVVVQVAPAAPSGSSQAAAAATPAAAGAAPVPSAPVAPLGGSAGMPAMAGIAAASPIGQGVATVQAQPAGVARECLSTLVKVIDNIVQHPLEEKYRKIKRANAGFSRKVGGVPGGEACMRALGFVEADIGQSWVLHPSASAWDVLNAGRARIQSALAMLPAAGGPPPSRTPGATGGFTAGLGELPAPGMFPGAFGAGGGGLGMGGGMPDMASMRQMAQNPAVMQGMMNDPTVQSMMRNNPQMGSAMQRMMANPALMDQAFNMMENNPAMAQQAQQMLQDPAALQRASQMDLGAAMAAGMGGARGYPQPAAAFGANTGAPSAPPPAPATRDPSAIPPPPAPAANPAANTASAGEGPGQEEKSEDELMAEAIRRSLEDT